MGDDAAGSNQKNASSRGAWPWSLLLGFSAAWLIGAAIAFSHIAIDILWFLALALSGGVIALIWCLMTLLEVIARMRAHPERLEMSPRRVFVWAAIPTVGFIGLLLAYTDHDLALRLQLSNAPLTERAESMSLSGSTASVAVNDRIGLFYVRDARVQANGTVRFTMQLPGIFTETGLIYDPHQQLPAAEPPQEEWERISEDWVKFVWSD
ncbi:MAG: hypothetical protein ACX94C_13455 [Phycisphaerales bacterium]